MKYRKATWLNTTEQKEVFAIEAKQSELTGGKWLLCGDDRPYLFDTKEERDSKLKELTK